jgi:hypothetical protein
VQERYSPAVWNDVPGRDADKKYVKLQPLGGRPSLPKPSVGASMRPAVIRTRTLSSESGQAGVVCILDVAAPMCSRKIVHRKTVRCRSLIGDRPKPTE